MNVTAQIAAEIRKPKINMGARNVILHILDDYSLTQSWRISVVTKV